MVTEPPRSCPSPVSRRIDGWFVLAVFALTVLAYFPAVRAGFVWDDDAHVTAPELRSLPGLGRIWSEVGATQQYYPLLHSVFWLEHRLWGDAPLGYHLVNIVLHAGAACLFALTLHRLGVPAARLAALLFALHPVQVESVAWISEQKNTLSLVLYLSAALAFLRFDATRARSAYVFASALFFAALLTKTITATLPAALLVGLWWQRGRLSWRRDVLPLTSWLVAGVGAGLFTAWIEQKVIGAEGASYALTPLQRSLLATRVLWFYLGKLAWPSGLSFVYPRWAIDPGNPLLWCAAAGVVALGFALWILRRRSRAPLAVALVFAGSLLPVLGFLNVYPFIYSFVADHFQYLASLGPIALGAAGLSHLGARLPAWSRGAGAVVLVAALGVLTWHQSRNYRTPETLYRATLRLNPACWMACNNLGKELMAEKARLPEAIACLEEALRLRPDYAEAENNLGLALNQAGRPRDAIPHLAAAIRLKPDSYRTHNNLGIALASSGQAEAALAAFARAAALNPRLPNIQENWAKALRLLGRPAEADVHFARAAELRARSSMPQ